MRYTLSSQETFDNADEDKPPIVFFRLLFFGSELSCSSDWVVNVSDWSNLGSMEISTWVKWAELNRAVETYILHFSDSVPERRTIRAHLRPTKTGLRNNSRFACYRTLLESNWWRRWGMLEIVMKEVNHTRRQHVLSFSNMVSNVPKRRWMKHQLLQLLCCLGPCRFVFHQLLQNIYLKVTYQNYLYCCIVTFSFKLFSKFPSNQLRLPKMGDNLPWGVVHP